MNVVLITIYICYYYNRLFFSSKLIFKLLLLFQLTIAPAMSELGLYIFFFPFGKFILCPLLWRNLCRCHCPCWRIWIAQRVLRSSASHQIRSLCFQSVFSLHIPAVLRIEHFISLFLRRFPLLRWWKKAALLPDSPRWTARSCSDRLLFDRPRWCCVQWLSTFYCGSFRPKKEIQRTLFKIQNFSNIELCDQPWSWAKVHCQSGLTSSSGCRVPNLELAYLGQAEPVPLLRLAHVYVICVIYFGRFQCLAELAEATKLSRRLQRYRRIKYKSQTVTSITYGCYDIFEQLEY